MVWNACPQLDETVTWSGACIDGKADGEGVLQWFRAATADQPYAGTLRVGKVHGRGTSSWPDGNWYEGEYRDNELNGHVTMFFPSGDWYKGEWRDGLPNGQGTAQFMDSHTYTGTWRDGCVRQGKYMAWLWRSEAECESPLGGE